MPHFLFQGSYAQEACARLVANPQDRTDAVRTPIEKLGGRVHTSFFAFAPFDVVGIMELPDNVTAPAITTPLPSGDAFKNRHTTPLIRPPQALHAATNAGPSSC